MGDLPAVRVNRTARAFVHTGIDYAGLIAIRTPEGINRKRPHFRMPHDQSPTLRARQRLYLYLYRSNDLFLAEDYVFRSMYFTAPIANYPIHMQKQLAILTSETRYRRNCIAFPIPCVTAFRWSVGGQR